MTCEELSNTNHTIRPHLLLKGELTINAPRVIVSSGLRLRIVLSRHSCAFFYTEFDGFRAILPLWAVSLTTTLPQLSQWTEIARAMNHSSARSEVS